MSGPRTVLDCAIAYHRRGYAVVPVPFKSKRPVLPEWQRLVLTEDDLQRHFAINATNIGILTGKPSGWLVDVDCDVPEAARVALDFLPRTPMVHGHGTYEKARSKPRSHFWYRSQVSTKKYQFIEADGKVATMIVELRSTGCQTIVPPSVHTGGESLYWDRVWTPEGERPDPTPADVSTAELTHAVAKVAASALIARHWPGRGSRDDAAMALCGMLARAGWTDDEIDHFALVTASAAGDEQWRDRAKSRQSRQHIAEGRNVTGAPRLATLLRDGERVVTTVREWLGLRGQQSADQPYMPIPAIDAHSTDRASMGIYGEEGHLWRGFIEVASVKPEAVKWLWQGRIPLGKITIVDGDPDLGKSVLFGADIPARITNGEAMPDGTPGLGEPAGVVLVSAEDEVPDTIRPRLDAAGADVSRVLAIYSVPRYKTLDDGSKVAEEGSFTIPRDLDWLRAAIAHKHAKYVLIDPLMSYLQPGETNSYRDQDVRTALAPLARLAAETGAAIVAIRHLNKGSAANPLYRGGGSIGIIAAARSAMLVAADPDDPTKQRRILARIKGNLAAPVPALAYHLAVTPSGVPVIAWDGETEHTAAQLLCVPVDEETRSETDEAVEWLRGELAGGERPAKDVEDAARGADIKPKPLRRARERLGVKPRRDGFGPGSRVIWSLPQPASVAIDAQHSIDAIEVHVPEQGTYASNGHKPKLTSQLAERVAQLNAQGIHGDAAVRWALAERGTLPDGNDAA